MEGGYDVFILLVSVKLMRIIFMPLVLLVGLLHLGVRMENLLLTIWSVNRGNTCTLVRL